MKPINANPNVPYNAPKAGAATPKPAAANEPKDTVTLGSRQAGPANRLTANYNSHIQERKGGERERLKDFLKEEGFKMGCATLVGGAVGFAMGGPLGALLGAGRAAFLSGAVSFIIGANDKSLNKT